jgi:hypothetical protein
VSKERQSMSDFCPESPAFNAVGYSDKRSVIASISSDRLLLTRRGAKTISSLSASNKKHQEISRGDLVKDLVCIAVQFWGFWQSDCLKPNAQIGIYLLTQGKKDV